MPKIWAPSLDEHRNLVRTRLVHAYTSLVNEEGLDAITVAAVAERAGLARSAVYNHVNNVHDLALVHAEMGFRTAAMHFDALVARGASPWEVVSNMARNAIHVWARDSLAGRELHSRLDDDQTRRLEELAKPVIRHLYAAITRGIERGVFVNRDPRQLGQFVWATVSGHRPLVRDHAVDVDATARLCVELIGRAILLEPQMATCDDLQPAAATWPATSVGMPSKN